jgi:tetratricopeptide (TPR) repeat protein
MLSRANEMATAAVRVGPTSAWVQSAHAWVLFVDGDFEHAIAISERAFALDPTDWHIQEFHSIILMLNGDLERAVSVLAPEMEAGDLPSGFVHRNVLAMSEFHLGRFDDAIGLIEELNKQGGASSPLTLSYLAASYQAAGNHRKANDLVQAFNGAWPGFPIDVLVRRIFRERDLSDQFVRFLTEAGWRPQEVSGQPGGG